MNCPACKNPMITLELNQIEVDYCTACKGLWLDSGELELILSKEDNIELSNSFSARDNLIEAKRRCPICKKKMIKVEFENTGVIIDRCKNNHGLWFDSGELQSILKTDEKHNSKIIDIIKEMFGE